MQPALPGASMGPGTAKTSRPCSRAVFAVMSAPLRSGASTTRTATESPDRIRFRTGKFPLRGSVPGAYSVIRAPAAATSS